MEGIGKRRTIVQRSPASTYAVRGSARRSGWLAFRPVSKQVLILRTWVVCLATVAFHPVPKQVSPTNLPSTTFDNRGVSPDSKAPAQSSVPVVRLVTVAFHPIPKPVRSESFYDLGLCTRFSCFNGRFPRFLAEGMLSTGVDSRSNSGMWLS